VSEHLQNAARVWEAMLAEFHPEHRWVVSVSEDEAQDRRSSTATTADLDQRSRSASDPAALAEHGGHGLDRAA
jgi:hypothetical protein